MRASFLRTLTAAVVTAALFGCGGSDGVVSPSSARPAPGAGAQHTLLSSPETVVGLQRTTPLAAPITVSKYIGALGGTISIPQAGLTVVVPPLALSSTKLITVTALAGSNVAYEFQPAGTKFNVGLAMTQSLVGTNYASVNPLNMFVGYFADSSNPLSVSEVLSVNVNLVSLTAASTIWHFSGYIYASGRDDSIDGGM